MLQFSLNAFWALSTENKNLQFDDHFNKQNKFSGGYGNYGGLGGGGYGK